MILKEKPLKMPFVSPKPFTNGIPNPNVPVYTSVVRHPIELRRSEFYYHRRISDWDTDEKVRIDMEIWNQKPFL